MEHAALYRKYRPQRFSDVRSQEHVVTVLEAAIAKRSIPHAILFTGTRGTGKTTLARIFARELGVLNEDLYELDAASNNSVEDIRALNEAVTALPFSSDFKVYILDEVHMLSKSAWNAFLKTLEEPPKHVIFIMATTEFDKVPETVLSRCQVFTLREPSRAAIADHVRDVFAQEHIKLSVDAVESISIMANGSYRDALSIAQKILILAEKGTLNDDMVAKVIGSPTSATVAKIFEGIASSNATGSLKALGEAVLGNASMDILITLLIERVRAVMLSRATNDQSYIQAYQEDSHSLEKHIGNARVNSRMLVRLLDAKQMVGASPIQSLSLECAIVDLCALSS